MSDSMTDEERARALVARMEATCMGLVGLKKEATTQVITDELRAVRAPLEWLVRDKCAERDELQAQLATAQADNARLTKELAYEKNHWQNCHEEVRAQAREEMREEAAREADKWATSPPKKRNPLVDQSIYAEIDAEENAGRNIAAAIRSLP